jgi:hypothetical protein
LPPYDIGDVGDILVESFSRLLPSSASSSVCIARRFGNVVDSRRGILDMRALGDRSGGLLKELGLEMTGVVAFLPINLSPILTSLFGGAPLSKSQSMPFFVYLSSGR